MITFEAASVDYSGAADSSVTITWPGTPSGQMLLAVLGFENVNAADTGGWVADSEGGWTRLLAKPPSVDGGCGLEVWYANQWGVGPTTGFTFDTARAYVAKGSVYNGQYTGAGNVIRAAASDQVSGDDPAAPSVYAFADELVIAVAAYLVQSPGYGAPAGYTSRYDTARGGTFGQVEITAADTPATVEGATGPIGWDALAAVGAHGVTATLAVRASAAVLAASSPAIALEWAAG